VYDGIAYPQAIDASVVALNASIAIDLIKSEIGEETLANDTGVLRLCVSPGPNVQTVLFSSFSSTSATVSAASNHWEVDGCAPVVFHFHMNTNYSGLAWELLDLQFGTTVYTEDLSALKDADEYIDKTITRSVCVPEGNYLWVRGSTFLSCLYFRMCATRLS
jgi:hypothetical protein